MLFNMSLVLVYLYMQEAERLGDLLAFLDGHLQSLPNYALEVLLLLPEEIDNYKVVIEERKRSYLLEYLRSVQVQVLVRLNEAAKLHWDQKDGVRKEILLSCFANWVSMKYNKQIMCELIGHYVLNAALTHIGDMGIAKECEQAILTVLRTMKGPKEDPELFQFLAKAVFPYYDVVRNHIKENMLDLSESYINVLAKFGRVAAPLFAESPTTEIGLFQQGMLELTMQVGLENIESIVKYWKKFCVKLHELKSEKSIAIYRPMLEQLYQVLSSIGQYTLKECEDLNTLEPSQIENIHQEFEDKRKYRDDIDELFDVLGELLTYERCVAISLQTISQLDVKDKFFWPKFEATLLPLVDIVDEVKEPSETLTATIKELAKLQPTYLCVRRAIIKVMKRCSRLYRGRTDGITTLIFHFLVAMLQQG